jgi:hypothetical protein
MGKASPICMTAEMKSNSHAARQKAAVERTSSHDEHADKGHLKAGSEKLARIKEPASPGPLPPAR